MLPRQQHYQAQSKVIIKALEKRYMAGYYCGTKEEAVTKALQLMKEGDSISWGGSMTLQESGLLTCIKEGAYDVYDRSEATSQEEIRAIYLKAFDCDHYLMSANAITLDGKLLNIDGNGNRLAAMIYGPRQVIVLVGMNKVVKDEEAGYKRIGNEAAPINACRLNRQTPCSKTGQCHDCLTDDTICCQIVTTRKSHVKGRIKVILVGEELGY